LFFQQNRDALGSLRWCLDFTHMESKAAVKARLPLAKALPGATPDAFFVFFCKFGRALSTFGGADA
jgi:hypothetical protein